MSQSSQSDPLRAGFTGTARPTRSGDPRQRELADVLRRARVESTPLLLRAPPTAGEQRVPFVAGPHAVVGFDRRNGVADIDGALTLSSAARRLEALGAIFPLARPLPGLRLAVACAALPFFVDAYLQQATMMSTDGEPLESPRAPRSATGPSLLATLCARPPLALLVRGRVRVLSRGQAVMQREEHEDTAAAARRVCELLADGRAFTVDAFGRTVLVLAGAPVSATRAKTTSLTRFAHAGTGRGASFGRARSLVPHDVDSVEAALSSGARVVAAPLMGRVAALSAGAEVLPVHEVSTAAALLGVALARGRSR